MGRNAAVARAWIVIVNGASRCSSKVDGCRAKAPRWRANFADRPLPQHAAVAAGGWRFPLPKRWMMKH
jgi:hypothetical protein